MSVRKRNVVTGRHSIQEKLEAVRLRMYGELSFNEVLSRYGITSATLSLWLKKYRSEVLRLNRDKGIPLYVLKTNDDMIPNEHEELERLRQEVADLKLINRAWEILAELGKERYNIDLKKTSRRRYPPGKPGIRNKKRKIRKSDDTLPFFRL